MRRIKKILTNRIVLVALLLLLQFALFALLIYSAGSRSIIISISLNIISVLVVLYIINRRDKPAYKITWTAMILAFPLFGGLMYLFFKLQSSAGTFRKLQAHYEEEGKKYLHQDEDVLRASLEKLERYSVNINYLHGTAGFPVYDNTEITYLTPGEEFFEHLLVELEKAERFIFIEVFIVDKGKMWDEILDILERKAAQGVDVRLIYDDIGSIFNLPKGYEKTLEAKGVKTTVFNPFIPFWNSVQNNRNHRKIIVIDGKAAYTGGANLCDEYINAVQRFGHWKDAMVCLRGDAIYSMTVFFLLMWNALRKTDEDYSLYKYDFPRISSGVYVQPYADTPLDNENVGEHVYLQIINAAKEYLYIQTPYLIPDDNLITALTLAAKSGVDVRIIFPHTPDKWLVYMTGRSYFPQLIESGVKIYEYTPGFIHSKVFVSDDRISTVGTVNLDFRSLFLHYECGTVIYDGETADIIKKDFEETLGSCRLIAKEEVTKNLPGRMLQAALRLVAPLM
ncbi:MAG: cardiolipin synthase [Clostridia bacterium]|nr:cardiolipin synthase [Clostridia bacterium]